MKQLRLAQSRSRGLTLVELMIAITIGLLIVAVVGSLYVGSARSYRQDERVSAMDDELRFALGRISRDIEMAGFWGSMLDPRALTRYCDVDPTSEACTAWTEFAATVEDCDTSNESVFLATGIPVQVRNEASAADINALFNCIAADEVLPGTAAISVLRVGATRLNLGDVVKGRPYLQTAGTEGALFIAADDGDAPDLLGVPRNEADYWRFQPAVYYIRRHTMGTDGVPSLCRKHLQPAVDNSALVPTTDCFAIGIEDMHFEFGIDTDGDTFSNLFTSSPTAAQLDQLAMVRIHALGRAQRPDGSYRNEKSFQLGDKLVAASNDNFYRRAASASVALRNPAAQRVLR